VIFEGGGAGVLLESYITTYYPYEKGSGMSRLALFYRDGIPKQGISVHKPATIAHGDTVAQRRPPRHQALLSISPYSHPIACNFALSCSLNKLYIS
jgi:hypothetical protein